ncbi:MAG: hypothetical protein K0S39_4252 [Paenibacillus sp.]|nr:hypothetical protein [Paenibacillus sp.]
MAIIIFGSLAILLATSFAVTKRKIHLFEGIVLWCFLLSIQNNFVWLFSLNFKLVELSRDITNYLAYDSIRSVIVPLLTILFLELNLYVNEVWKKTLSWAGIIMLLVGIEYMAELLDILVHSEEWKLWWSFANWTSNVGLSFAVHKSIRYVARKDVKI